MKTIVDLETDLVKPYIDEEDEKFAANIAPVETSPATGAHAVGSQIIYNGVLYDVTAAIAATDALVVGTNIAAADDVVTQIAAKADATALENEVVTRATYSIHNLLPFPYPGGGSTTKNGLTFTVNSDGSITVSGTASAETTFRLYNNDTDYLKGKDVILTGCPSGGSNSTYALGLWNADTSSGNNDYGEGVAFTFPSTSNSWINLVVRNGVAISPALTFYPMIRLATDVDDTYRPYVPTNAQLLSYKYNGIMGSKNLLPFNLELLKDNNTAGTWSDNTYTIGNLTYTVVLNSDGTLNYINVNGTSTAAATTFMVLPSGIVDFGDTSIGDASIEAASANGFTISGGSDGPLLSNLLNLQYRGGTKNIVIMIPNANTTISNLKVYPMVRHSEDTDASYQPYAKTNRQITAATGAYYRTSVTSRNLANNTEDTVLTVSNLPAGVYVVEAKVLYPTGASYSRYIRLDSSLEYNVAKIQGDYLNSQESLTAVARIKETSGYLSLILWQRSGAAITLDAYLMIVRIA